MKVGQISWFMSVVLHLGVLVLGVFGLPELRKDRPAPPPPIAVEFVKIAEKTQVAEPEPEEEKSQPVEEVRSVARAEPQAAPEEAAVPLPTLDPVQRKKPVAKPKPKPELTETQKLARRVTLSRKPRPPSRIKSNRLAALIDKSIKEEQEPVRKTAEEKPEKTPDKQDPYAGLRGRIAVASLRDALSQKLAGCWNFPSGAKGVDQMEVTVRIWLKGDGTLSKTPEFVKSGDLNDGFYRSFAESARRAVVSCEPFLEAKEYIASGRSYIDFNFNGAQLGGG